MASTPSAKSTFGSPPTSSSVTVSTDTDPTDEQPKTPEKIDRPVKVMLKPGDGFTPEKTARPVSVQQARAESQPSQEVLAEEEDDERFETDDESFQQDDVDDMSCHDDEKSENEESEYRYLDCTRLSVPDLVNGGYKCPRCRQRTDENYHLCTPLLMDSSASEGEAPDDKWLQQHQFQPHPQHDTGSYAFAATPAARADDPSSSSDEMRE